MSTAVHVLGTIVLGIPLGIGAAPQAQDTWVATVTTDGAVVRCGANESYYPMESLQAGDLLLVTGERHNWYRVDTIGNVFTDTIGYVKYPAVDAARFSVTEKTGTAQSDLEVIAKNIDTDEMYRSWRPVAKLNRGDTVRVIESVTMEPGTLHPPAYVVHTVRMPATGTAWVNAAYLKPATTEQSTAFMASPDTAARVQETPNETGVKTEAAAVVPTETPAIAEETEDTTPPITLAGLEDAWARTSAEAIIGAEITPLHDLYVQLMEENTEDLVIQRVAGARAKQMEIWAAVQEQEIRIETLRMELATGAEDVDAYKLAMAISGEYAAIGRLALSNTFDGRLRPMMYRLQDPRSGRTVAYIPQTDAWDLTSMLGQTIGVSGSRGWDPQWRVQVVAPQRLDLLAPAATAVVPEPIE